MTITLKNFGRLIALTLTLCSPLSFASDISDILLPEQVAPFFEPIENQTIVVGEQLNLLVIARQPNGEVPGLATAFRPSDSNFRDNGDGTRTLQWRAGVEDIGINRITFTAISSQLSSSTATLDVDVTVLPAISSAQQLRIIAPAERPVRPGEEIALRIVALDDSGQIPALFITEDSLRDGATFDDNGDGSRTLRWRAPDTFTTGGGISVSFIFEIVAVSASVPGLIVLEELELPFIRADDPSAPFMAVPALILPSNISGFAGDDISFQVAATTPSGEVANLRVEPLSAGITFSDNGNGTRTFSWLTEATDTGEWMFTFYAEDPADGGVSEQSVSITVAPPI